MNVIPSMDSNEGVNGSLCKIQSRNNAIYVYKNRNESGFNAFGF